jgi:hypothetical protein
LRVAASSTTLLATPCALKMVTALGGDLREILDEPGALRLQTFYDMFVVHNLVTHIDGRSVFLQRALHDLDGTNHTGAESTRLREDNLHRLFVVSRHLKPPCRRCYAQ